MPDTRTLSPAQVYLLARSARLLAANARGPRREEAQALAEWLDAHDGPLHVLSAPGRLPAWLDGGREHLTPHQWPEIGGADGGHR